MWIAADDAYENNNFRLTPYGNSIALSNLSRAAKLREMLKRDSSIYLSIYSSVRLSVYLFFKHNIPYRLHTDNDFLKFYIFDRFDKYEKSCVFIRNVCGKPSVSLSHSTLHKMGSYCVEQTVYIRKWWHNSGLAGSCGVLVGNWERAGGYGCLRLRCTG